MKKKVKVLSLPLLFVASALLLPGSPACADPHVGQSVNVVMIGGSTLDTNTTCGYGNYTTANTMYATYGGCLPVSGPVGELGDFHFSPMLPSAVSAASLVPYDTAVLNVASYAMHCNTNTLTDVQRQALVDFVGEGKKLIIYDSECTGTIDYSWLPYPFTTANPGAMGAPGTLWVVEDNTLSTKVGDPTCISGDPHCINVSYLSISTDAVGDMNVMTTYDPNWFLDMSGTNYLNVTGPVHTYANYPPNTDDGLIIYNGLDVDYLAYDNDANLRKIWVQELQQPFNPSDLPSSTTVVGINISPLTAVNMVGDDHTVTARLADMKNTPQVGIEVDFDVISGPNVGVSGTCSANADCTSDANGEVSFTYTGLGGVGTDAIVASFDNESGVTIPSQTATKEWVLPEPCDVNDDGVVDIADITAIGAHRNTTDLTYDMDGDGVVTVLDVRKCVLECDNPLCAPNP